MFQSLTLLRKYRYQFTFISMVSALLTSAITFAQVGTEQVPLTNFEYATKITDTAVDMNQATANTDPLDSPYPVPWNWVLDSHAQLTANGKSGFTYYRSPSLISPDGQYAAYSRIKMQAEPELFRSNVTSVMFMENLQTGDLMTINPSSPLANNTWYNEQENILPGAIAILIPVSWSEDGERILSRQFEGIFSTSEASDYAVVWDRDNNKTSTITPQVEYTNAVLLGWSGNSPEHILFRAGILGDEQWPMWAVNLDGDTALAGNDLPQVYGQYMNPIWSGPQAMW